MQIILDLILISTSLTAIVFCYLLDRRLRSMRTATGDFGATINALSHTIETARENVVLAKQSSDESVDRLSQKITEASALLNELSSALETQSRVSDEGIAEINDVVRRAKSEIQAEIESIQNATQSEFQENTHFLEEDDADTLDFAPPPEQHTDTWDSTTRNKFSVSTPFASTCTVSYANNQALMKL